jgi:sugar phosphate isomerase/epimerase
VSRSIQAGLCSITLRKLEADAVLKLAVEAGLDAIEWGADVHAPPDDIRSARALAERCAAVGLRCPSYGSYFFAGRTPPDALPALLDTAEALGATTLRIWAELGVEPDAAADDRRRVTEAVAHAVALAAERELSVGLEFHPGTLTHTAASALELLRTVEHPRLFSYWQPLPGDSLERSLSELSSLLPDLAHLHVFSWDPDPQHRRPLAHLEAMWRSALELARVAGRFVADRIAYLEYVPDDEPAELVRDAATLRSWLAEGGA